ncbi:hypothetical protein BDW22DRAFT_1433646 [Trametopsis cervina]|nr:hypothetical protein BDW22DRAFT_1433646 [Trametopsis cervina]
MFVLLLLVYALFVQAIRVNRTIDDTYGDLITGVTPQYSATFNPGQDCPGCSAQPDPASAFLRSWHDATHDSDRPQNLTLNITFSGIAIYVFFIMEDQVRPFITSATSMDIVLDGLFATTFTHAPSNLTDYEYNVCVYSNDNLPAGQHTVSLISNGPPSLMLFDYANYTVDTESPSSSNSISLSTIFSSHSTSNGASPTIGPIPPTTSSAPASTQQSWVVPTIAAVLGGIGGITLTIVCFLFLRRRKRQGRLFKPFSFLKPSLVFKPIPADYEGAPREALGGWRAHTMSQTRHLSNSSDNSLPPDYDVAAATAALEIARLRLEVDLLRQDLNFRDAPPDYTSNVGTDHA